MLAQLSKVAVGPVSVISVQEQEEELSTAEDALWAWSLEWSKVARIAIKQRSLLRQLGFLTRHAVEEDPAPTADPAPPLPAQPAKTGAAVAAS